ncbi:redoxin domain-containing protein [Paenibacillus campinasensis]|uniref:Redoxin domain-containing protein n=2 Tax=Paenibacillus TaxID=44249 RepID=A0ABW9T257_9BACL|nr:redoxin domain-containing protein [Paenibacillus campinasensis]
MIAVGYLLFGFYFRQAALPVKMNSPEFTLLDIHGQTVTENDYDGKVRLTSFIFTRCPDICPATTINMVALQNELQKQGTFGDEVEFVSITFDPDNDTPEVLKQYAERLGIDQSGWSLLRGEEEKVKELAAQYNLSIVRLDDGLFAHSITSLLLIDGQQRVRAIYRMGEDMENEQILKDIDTLLKEQQKDL